MISPTDQELEKLALEIYWHMEHGEQKEAIQKLRRIIEEAEERGDFNATGIV